MSRRVLSREEVDDRKEGHRFTRKLIRQAHFHHVPPSRFEEEPVNKNPVPRTHDCLLNHLELEFVFKGITYYIEARIKKRQCSITKFTK